MQTRKQPLSDLGARCKLPVGCGLPASLPGAQTVGVPGTALPAQSSPASAVVQGAGPLPGPATVATR